jgi:hypothetical protein
MREVRLQLLPHAPRHWLSARGWHWVDFGRPPAYLLIDEKHYTNVRRYVQYIRYVAAKESVIALSPAMFTV